ncbi:MAG: hypothetical protein ACKV22_41620, partial [Bryobacteraceae bacterium]
TSQVAGDDELYLHAIPYMQFPLLLAGRPFTGERSAIPGVEYRREEQDGLLRRWRRIWRHYQAHPEGPYVYGPWDAFPPRSKARTVHAKWLRQYLPLVEEGTWAYLEITGSTFFPGPLPADVVASVFANLDTYLVLANYGRSEAMIDTAHAYIPVTSEDRGEPANRWRLAPRSLTILVRV